MITASLHDLLDGLVAATSPALECSGLQLDSRAVAPNDLYVANIGLDPRVEGFVREAIANGAGAVLVDELAQLSDDLATRANIVRVAGLERKLGTIASRYYGAPSRSVLVLATTGTNGKTSGAIMQAQMLGLLGVSCHYIGTLGAGSLDKLAPTGFTTPPADQLQQLLYRAHSQSVRAVAMEVSSHGLAQHRIDGTNIDVAVFTNLSREHLDYHGTMAHYGQTKARLFGFRGLRAAVINCDDAFSPQLIEQVNSHASIVRVSLRQPTADFYLSDIVATARGYSAMLHSPAGEFAMATPLLGEFNLYNVLLVCAAVYAAGYPVAAIAANIGKLTAPVGRMQVIAQQPLVIVDYAHTPDALAKACVAARAHCRGRLILVFGCGGDRDIGKRPQMGEVAAAKADLIILTNDNPRSESPAEIAEQILLGVPVGAMVIVELDRSRAIKQAINEAKPDDCVLIAGKGHEQYQDIGGKCLAFNDAQVARAALAEVAA